MEPLQRRHKCISQSQQVRSIYLMKVIGNLAHQDQSLAPHTLNRSRKLTLARKVCAANSLAAKGVSGDMSKMLQVDHASDWNNARGIRCQRPPSAGWDQKAKVFTECWKS